MNRRSNRVTTFRFPFDIDHRYFLALALFFFILSVRQVTDVFSPTHSVSKIKNRIESDVNEKIGRFERMLNDSLLIGHAFDQTLSESEFNKLQLIPYSIYFYKEHNPVYWNSIGTISPMDTFTADEPLPYQDSTGYYVLYRKVITSVRGGRSIISLFKIKNDFGLENRYFSKNFPVDDKENDFNIALSLKAKEGAVPLNIQGKTLFYMYQTKGALHINDKSGWRLFLNAIPFILFGVSIHTYYKVRVNKINSQWIFALLMLTILSVRIATYLWAFPNDFHEYRLFSPDYFKGDLFHRSLGDLFVNMCLVFWALLFYLINVQGKVYDLRKNRYRYLIGVIVFVILLCGLFYLSDLVYRIVYESDINFDTTRFSELELPSFIGILTFMAIFVNFVYLTIVLRNYLAVCFGNKYLKYGLIGLTFLLFLLVDISIGNKASDFYTLICTAILFLMLDLDYLRTKFDFSSYKLLIWLIFISVTGSFFLTRLIVAKDRLRMAQYAEQLIHRDSVFVERQLNDKLQVLEQDEMFKQLVSNRSTDSKMLSNYVQTWLFTDDESDYRVVVKANSKQAELRNELLSPNDRKVNGKVVYQVMGDVLMVYPVIGHVPVEIQIQRNMVKPINQYADLLQIEKHPDLLENEVYSSAKFFNDTLVSRTGVYLFPFHLLKPVHFDRDGRAMVSKGNYVEVWVEDKKQQTKIAIVKENNSIFLFTTLFAYIFLIYFLTISLYILGNIVARSNLNYKRFINLMSINLRLRIHFAILLVELFSFVIIGYFTSYFLIEKVNNEMRASLSKYNYSIQEEFKRNSYTDFESNADGSVWMEPAEAKQKRFKEIADKYAINLNIYGVKDGKLLFSSMPGLFRKGILSDYLEPDIFQKVKSGYFHKIIEKENLGFLNYLSSYFYLRNSEGKEIGIVQIPFFRSQAEFNMEATTIITTLINIYIFVFLVSAIIAFFLTKSVTRPFTYIVKQFTKINLSKTNEPLKWFDSDEIGLLIKEYNRMLRKLENSTVLLAKNERELAWREMAKQVAHEIKNPLTPMKLSLQMLERAIHNNATNVNEITVKMTKTLVEQIDNLSLIATNFSNFAKLPVSKNEIFPLNEILYSVTGMYHDDNNNEFLFMIPDYEITLYADKSQIMRVLTNIIQNAIQSIPEERKGNIALTVSKIKNNQIRISISDNGEGISAEKGNSLFQPYFTTKTSGTGLGLAMCKDIIEESGGKITYESLVGSGTMFHIDLPVYQPE